MCVEFGSMKDADVGIDATWRKNESRKDVEKDKRITNKWNIES